jgi:hypothetical protein
MGHADAQSVLGICYQDGYGVAQDYAEAVKWYRRAAALGDASAQSSLGFCYEYGYGVAQDYAEAIKWYHKAAAQGNVIAQCAIGFRYEYGRGVPQDYRQAHMWYNLAGMTDSDAQKWREEVASKMTPEQIAEAQQMAKEWLEQHQPTE